MNDDERKNLIDILHATEEIQSFTHKMDYKGYHNSPITQRAVERNFEIIGNSLERIKQIDGESISKVSEYHRIMEFSNILIHGYNIDEKIVWNAVVNHLPLLLKRINEILEPSLE
ncbi:MAG: DUF86 domain-containing protein [bacterium]|nr:DUF86 domain-containing protein [bacterium]